MAYGVRWELPAAQNPEDFNPRFVPKRHSMAFG